MKSTFQYTIGWDPYRGLRYCYGEARTTERRVLATNLTIEE